MREIENVKKNLGLGEWAVGNTSAIFKLDARQYDRERENMEADLRSDRIHKDVSEVLSMHRSIYSTLGNAITREDTVAEQRLEMEIAEDNQMYIPDDDGDGLIGEDYEF